MPAKPQKIHRVIVSRTEDVIICWKKPGSYIEKRCAYRRVAGDEDICSPGKAKQLQIAGLVDILGSKSEVMKDRTIGFNSIVDSFGSEL